MVERAAEIGATSAGKKGGKKGFKVDRYERYQEHRKQQQGLGTTKASKKEKPGSVKEVRFDATDRKEFLTGFHKRKNERRATAFLDMKHKQKVENSKFRREQREEARKAYNAYAKVPILPDYSYHLPSAASAAGAGEDDEDSFHGEENDDGIDDSFFRADNELGDYGDGVSVTVQPLRRASHGALPTNDFSDLPKAVADELKRLKQQTKGPAKTKAKKNTLKTLEKIRKIQKHSRKGHGKKAAKGKKRNR
eukprot:CAMPEP_0176408212 /NCGR_PEP_ID=MMETSP0127-20121128/1827_1 /TAXON_ID=938130 /ORGANISM="Platyophrya macrostoma, Strain WH" /LENGTH=249 /DNA_ID=CAMNT_0017787475 /DNA_START=102 /DNA_END=851 /DNA_ORIENTATION=+